MEQNNDFILKLQLNTNFLLELYKKINFRSEKL